MSLEGRGIETSSLDTKTTTSYTSGTSKPHVEGIAKPYPSIEEHGPDESGMNEPVQEYDVTQQKKGAKIHDFCFGIPFGECALSSDIFMFNLHYFGAEEILLARFTVCLHLHTLWF